MQKNKKIFVCQNCGAQSVKWIGKCPSCNEWNSYSEEIVTPVRSSSLSANSSGDPLHIDQIDQVETNRIHLPGNEFNRVLGGGLVAGSVVLLGGEPGIGKSTLVLQTALQIELKKVLYISGEESPQQLKIRASRLQSKASQVYILSETHLEYILNTVDKFNPDIIIVDSIQTLFSEKIESIPGSISQVRECAFVLMELAKKKNIPCILIGHITKDGSIAGPKLLEHMVDTVVQFEGDQNHLYRILRAHKNRFGPTSEIGIYTMHNDGLREVENPSELLLSSHKLNLSGVAIGASLEGITPLLIEVQSLVSSAVYGTPQRSATGYDIRRLNMLLAVLEKRAGFRLSAKDVFLNIAGGIKMYDPAIDLAIMVSVISSDLDAPVNHKSCFAAEIGLSGEIRPVTRVDQRIYEADKLGFEQIFISSFSPVAFDRSLNKIKVQQVAKISDVLKILFK